MATRVLLLRVLLQLMYVQAISARICLGMQSSPLSPLPSLHRRPTPALEPPALFPSLPTVCPTYTHTQSAALLTVWCVLVCCCVNIPPQLLQLSHGQRAIAAAGKMGSLAACRSGQPWRIKNSNMARTAGVIYAPALGGVTCTVKHPHSSNSSTLTLPHNLVCCCT